MEIITISQLVAALKKTFPEFEQPIEELNEFNDTSDSFKQNEYAYLVFSYVFNPFLLRFLSTEQDTNLGKRLFNFLETMAQSIDMQVIHVLVVIILKALTQEHFVVAQKYMGPKTTQKNLCMWNKEEFNHKLKKEPMLLEDKVYPYRKHETVYDEQKLFDLEKVHGFALDDDTRSFFKAIGPIKCYETSMPANPLGCPFPWLTLQISDTRSYVPCATNAYYLASENPANVRYSTQYITLESTHAFSYVIYEDGFLRSHPAASSLIIEEYASFAHFIEEIILCMRFLNTIPVYTLCYQRIHKNDEKLLQKPKPSVDRTKDPLTQTNFSYFVDSLLPEFNLIASRLSDSIAFFKDSEYQYNWNSSFILYIFTPVLKHFLAHQTSYMISKRLFYFLEKMAESPEEFITQLLKEGVLSRLTHEELMIAQKYMGPSLHKFL